MGRASPGFIEPGWLSEAVAGLGKAGIAAGDATSDGGGSSAGSRFLSLIGRNGLGQEVEQWSGQSRD